ncbi:MAG: hypothetical protein MPJ24_02065 [Pirellulaceae bacterium]|nr:hypothetical protein [Pirellulaceae bacterium]
MSSKNKKLKQSQFLEERESHTPDRLDSMSTSDDSSLTRAPKKSVSEESGEEARSDQPATSEGDLASSIGENTTPETASADRPAVSDSANRPEETAESAQGPNPDISLEIRHKMAIDSLDKYNHLTPEIRHTFEKMVLSANKVDPTGGLLLDHRQVLGLLEEYGKHHTNALSTAYTEVPHQYGNAFYQEKAPESESEQAHKIAQSQLQKSGHTPLS